MEEFKILIKVVSQLYNIDLDTLTAKTRKRDFVELRYACVNLLLEYSSLSIDEIAPLLKIDRTTGYNALKIHENSNLNSSNESYVKKYSDLKELFIEKLNTPKRIKAKINALKEKRSKIDGEINELEILLESKTVKLEI